MRLVLFLSLLRMMSMLHSNFVESALRLRAKRALHTHTHTQEIGCFGRFCLRFIHKSVDFPRNQPTFFVSKIKFIVYLYLEYF